MINSKIKLALLASTLSAAFLSGCSDDDDKIAPIIEPEPLVVTYDVTVTNLTYSQPFSPLSVVLHNDGALWSIGEPASVALEKLAESGDNSELFALSYITVSAAGSGILMPGTSETVSISIEDTTESLLSLATMLVNTNDGFTGLNSISLSDLMVGDSWSAMTGVYDAGTEANSEMAGTIPGPADGGAGYESARDDSDMVSMHRGIVSMDDGLMSSVLTHAHKFDQPTAKITITRTE
ncbi:spondin domain-containing protein [Psychrosphaera haliotis]|nr:spondin domain-containing protein [Psychrosphaera haliotis]